MKNKCKESSMLYAAVLVTAIFALAACKHEAGKPKPPQTYAITMEYDAATGTASASPNPAAKGQTVTITAQAAGNYKFKLWEVLSGGVVLSSVFANPAEFTMPAEAVTIRAEFELLSDVTLDEIVYGYEQPAKRNIAINALGLDTQTVSGIAMAGGEESPFELDTTDINNKIAVGNVLGFYVQPKIGLKTGSHSDAVNITHGGGKTAVFSIMITVSPKPLSVSGLTAEDKEYDGTLDAVISGTPVLEGLVEGDDVELGEGTAVFDDHNAGTARNVVLDGYTLSGADAGNYTLSSMQEGLSADITPRPVTVIVTGQPTNILIPFGTDDAAYLGNTYRKNAAVSITVSGLIPGETVTVHVSENSYGLSGSADSGEEGTLTVEYDGTELAQTAAVQAGLEAAGNYKLEALNTPLFDARISDGLAEDRWIPVAMANISEFNDYASSANGLNRHYRLVEDIVLPAPEDASNWTAIGTIAAGFKGGFDGNGFFLQNLTISSNSSNQGMFGVVETDGVIRNAALVDSNISGNNNIGGLAGSNRGTIETSYVTGTVNGSEQVGGLIGSNQGTVLNCYATSNVSGSRFIGGIAGYVNGGTIRYCYATGTVNCAVAYAGGIAGLVGTPGRLENCAALNSKITTEGTSADIGRVVGQCLSLDLIGSNYAWRSMSINKIIDDSLGAIDGNGVSYDDISQPGWWVSIPNWIGEEWNLYTVWQLNTGTIPKLQSAGGTQNYSLSVYYKMAQLPAGSFFIGSPNEEVGRNADEGPQQPISLSSFLIGVYEVTREQYYLIMKPSSSSSPSEMPAYLSWYEALAFCNTLSMAEGLSPAYSIKSTTNPLHWGNMPTSADAAWDAAEIVSGSDGYRLPTEAQWEYACRAGSTTAYAGGNAVNDAMCWYANTATPIAPGFYLPREVGTKLPNAWGLYDMHGNINEWCWDWYGPYTGNVLLNPQGPPSGTTRVHRGGNVSDNEYDVRSAARFNSIPNSTRFGNFNTADSSHIGLRLVRP